VTRSGEYRNDSPKSRCVARHSQSRYCCPNGSQPPLQRGPAGAAAEGPGDRGEVPREGMDQRKEKGLKEEKGDQSTDQPPDNETDQPVVHNPITTSDLSEFTDTKRPDPAGPVALLLNSGCSFFRLGIAVEKVLEDLQSPFFLGVFADPPWNSALQTAAKPLRQLIQNPQPEQDEEYDCQAQGDNWQHLGQPSRALYPSPPGAGLMPLCPPGPEVQLRGGWFSGMIEPEPPSIRNQAP